MKCDIHRWIGYDEKTPAISLLRDKKYLVIMKKTDNVYSVADENNVQQMVLVPYEGVLVKE